MALVMGWTMGSDVRTLGRWIRSRRESLGIQQKDLAALARCDAAWLSKWETGRTGTHLPDPEILARIADALGTTVSEMLTVAGIIPAGEADGLESLSGDALVFTSLAESVDWEHVSDDVKSMIRRDLELARDISRRAGRE